MTAPTPGQIINKAINDWNPSHVVCLYSGGYDSLVATHLAHRLLDVPIYVFSIGTRLSADGWCEYVCGVADSMGWRHDIYDNLSGYLEYLAWVREYGQPYSVAGHKRAYTRLKDRAIDAMLRDHKTHYQDKVLFLSGIRQAEGVQRQKLANPIQRKGSKKKPMNAIFANPLFYWTDEDVLRYRIENELPDNPFYETVGGSGDCQCNWGQFITLRKLQRHSPCLASGNVATINEISNKYHGYGWDGIPAGQTVIFDDFEDGGEATSPFLCQGCSKTKTPRPGIEQARQMRFAGEW